MPNTRARRTGLLLIIPTLALGLIASCGKESGGGGSGGSGPNTERTGGSGGRGGAGGASGGSGGSTGTGGSGSGQTGGTGLPGTGGSGAGGSGSTGDAGPAANYNPPADKAVAKFCNGLVGENMMILEFALEIGMQPVRLVAKSGECFPAVNQACSTIPVGPVTVKIVDMADGMLLAEGNTMIMGGTQMLFYTDIDQTTMMPFLGAQPLRSDVNCAIIGLTGGGTPPPDGGAPMPPPRPPIRP